MLLKNTALNFKEPIEFNVKYKSIYYSVNVRFLPYNKNIDIETVHIENLNTPIAHFEFNLLKSSKSVYRSQYIMSGHLLEFEKEYPLKGINKMAQVIVETNGYLQRIDQYLKELEHKNQLSLFH